MQLEAVLIDLRDKIPCLQHILRPEYAPYLTTVATALIGWLFISWILRVFSVMWMLFIPLIMSTIASILIYPTIGKWCFQQLEINLEKIINNFVH
ncbi:uncharacterized protein LOC112552794 [Pogonomyrmex barbatus]|uniref:Uncharacterized protein LOC112552794 n=1 Tax=Pogonomyrmex barbatus TaxID=144034 RepID=A0A8N1S6X9_9HYME|nr:uncharacterized protein LOC112552794 [Pogonomyrmex barbatus]